MNNNKLKCKKPHNPTKTKGTRNINKTGNEENKTKHTQITTNKETQSEHTTITWWGDKRNNRNAMHIHETQHNKANRQQTKQNKLKKHK